MKVTMRSILALAFAVIVATGCRDKDAEKRIAELENEVKALKGQKSLKPETREVHKAEAKTKPEGPLPVAVFNEVEHDFGSINEGVVAEHTFTVKNTGEAPLVIEKASPSCGCTVPDWTKSPIPPGGSGFVKVKFDSKGKPGMQNKNVTVVANTWPSQTVLRFKANVTPISSSEGPIKH